MGKDTEISWTHHSFNVVFGCTKISEACKHCYAETFAHRLGLKVWGQDAPRKTMSDKYWLEPLKWNRAAAKAGERHRVFCSSMADVFEDHPTVAQERLRLWPLIKATPHLDWLLLTKRPEHMVAFAPASWSSAWPENVWAGTTVENQKRANERIPHLLRVPAAVRFLSMEPLFEAVNLHPFLCANGNADRLEQKWSDMICEPRASGISWVIAGGESGHGARPMHPAWAASLRDQCAKASVAFHFKQHGEWQPIDQPWKQDNIARLEANEQWLNAAGGQGFHGEDVWRMRRVGKGAAGRLLDGVQHAAFPRRPALSPTNLCRTPVVMSDRPQPSVTRGSR